MKKKNALLNFAFWMVQFKQSGKNVPGHIHNNKVFNRTDTRKVSKALAMLAGMFIILITQACLNDDLNDDPFRLHQERLKVGRALLEVTSGGVDDVLPYYSDDIEYHDPIVDIYGIDHMTGFLNQLIEGSSPDLRTVIVEETLTNDIYSATWIMDGSFNGIPYEAKGISIFKFKPHSSQVYYQRDYYSEGDIMATIKNPDGSPGLDVLMFFFRDQYKCAVVPGYVCQSSGTALSADNNQLKSEGPKYNSQLDVGRLLVQLDAENWPDVIPYLTSSYTYHDPIVDIIGTETMEEFLGRLFAGSTDLYTIVEDETLVDDIYMATWTMTGIVNGAVISAPGMSIVKFVEGTNEVYYSRDYYSEGDIMLGIPQLSDAVLGFRNYYLCAVDPKYDCQTAP